MNDPLNPSPVLLVKLGSVIVHLQEILSYSKFQITDKNVHAMALPSDIASLNACLNAPEMKEWLEQMDALALVPKKR